MKSLLCLFESNWERVVIYYWFSWDFKKRDPCKYITWSDYLNLNSLHCLLYILYNFTFENLVFDQKISFIQCISSHHLSDWKFTFIVRRNFSLVSERVYQLQFNIWCSLMLFFFLLKIYFPLFFYWNLESRDLGHWMMLPLPLSNFLIDSSVVVPPFNLEFVAMYSYYLQD